MINLKKGDKSPAFSGVNQDGKTISSEQLLGQKYILYFYPKDSTPGCTAEACNLRDNYEFWKGKGYTVIGVSADSMASHKRFIEKNSLPFDLISDTEKLILNSFGVWDKKKMCGREYFGILRATFVINEEGLIDEVFTKVDTKNHSEQILKVIK
ncbi:MAG: thioredoxin-dependent thiol peroxidase [Bacteroidales bacterium]|nr:thioredoxin-dependent thiol peroxidase [Bacteroidales bacterium]